MATADSTSRRRRDFRSHVLPWLEMGGVYAVANIRGGSRVRQGMVGEAELGSRSRTCSTTLSAAAEYLIAKRYTSHAETRDPGRLERRIACRCGSQSASRSVRCGTAGGRRDGHGPFPRIHDRLGMDIRLRLDRTTRKNSKPYTRIRRYHNVKARHEISGDAGHDGGPRRPRVPGPQLQIRCGDAGGTGWRCSGADPHRDQSRPRSRKTDVKADRRVG